jgi:hypothetical protein
MPRQLIFVLVFTLGSVSFARGQTGDGSLRGYVRDEQGGALPGVTVTAASNALIHPSSAVTDDAGYYRLINLPPGTYVITAELTGFATYKREGILLRAGANFEVDAAMTLGNLQETVTVAGETPMLEVSKPSNVLNISGEFQRQMPIQARRNWSDFLELTPGVNARPFDDGSGRMVYFGHATEHFAHVLQLEGMIVSNYNDAQVTYVGMNADMLDDTQIKTGGVDASAPAGTGLVVNVLTKSGGNTFKGSAGYDYQPFSWNGNNAKAAGSGNFAGTPTTSKVNQFDAGLGGPIRTDKVWFFGSIRSAKLENGISRTPENVMNLNAFDPGFQPFTNVTKSWQPYVKVTAQVTPNHQLVALYQRDRLLATGNREYDYDPIVVYSTGGSLYGAKLNSVWGRNVTTTLLASYNDKGGSDASTYNGYVRGGPEIDYHQNAFQAGATVIGTGLLAEGGNLDPGYKQIDVSSLVTLRGDLTWYRTGWAGSHEFQTGFFGAPRSRYDQRLEFINDGFTFEERRQIDPGNPAAGTVPFHHQFVSPTSVNTRAARDRDLAIYAQDTWKPAPRLTANVGIRFDFVNRFDDIFKITRQSSHEVQPRVGVSYLLTSDARNVLRASYVRVSEQMMGRDAVTTFGASNFYAQTDYYDLVGDGNFARIPAITKPAITTSALASNQFDPTIHQPFVDEFILGYRKQFPGQIAVDVAGIERVYKDTYARYDINGFYPDGPFKPFGGFGRVDPGQGIVYRQTNNSWSRLNYQALEVTATKSMSHGLQWVANINRQWQNISGTWNPTDPARFIQPDAFANDKLIWQPRGNNEDNSLATNTNLTYGPTWRKYSMRFGGTWLAPLGFTVAASYTVQAGPWSGALLQRLGVTDPQLLLFGPATFKLSDGSSAGNPLATRIRFVYPTRGEGQVQARAIKTLGLKIGKKIKLAASQEVEVAANLFNVMNGDNFNQYTYNGANQNYNPNFLQLRNQQPARAAQLTMVFRF